MRGETALSCDLIRMSHSWNRVHCCLAAVCVAVCACGRGPAPQKPEYVAAAERAQAGLVGPLKDDTGDEIVSWVDGQVVTDWAAEIGETRARDRRVSERCRSGPRREVRVPQRAEPPAGLELVPQQSRSDSTACRSCCSRRFSISIRTIAIRRCAPSLASGSARQRVPAGSGSAPPWTLDHIGVGPDPSDYADGVARPVGERQSPLPFGFAFENPRTFEPLSSPSRTPRTTRGCWRDGFSRTPVCSLPRLRTVDQGGKLGARPPRLWQPRHVGSGVLFVRRLPRWPRVVSGKMKFLPGMPNTEIEAQYYSKLLMLTGCGAGRIRVRPGVHHSCESRRHQAQYERRPRPVHRDARQGAAAAGNAVRIVAGANRARRRFRRWRSPTSSRA